MTVSELIAALEKFDGATPVVLAADVLGQYENLDTVGYDSESYFEVHNGQPVVVLGID